jgi:hypothetical protein
VLYVSTPYDAHPNGLNEAYVLACEQTALLLKAGVIAISPISHGHGIALHGDMDARDHAIWLRLDAHLMQACSGMVEVHAPGWQDSYGMMLERDAFIRMGKPIVEMVPGVVPEGLR